MAQGEPRHRPITEGMAMSKDQNRQAKIVLALLAFALISNFMPTAFFITGAVALIWLLVLYKIADWIVEKYK